MAISVRLAVRFASHSASVASFRCCEVAIGCLAWGYPRWYQEWRERSRPSVQAGVLGLASWIAYIVWSGVKLM